MTAYATIPADDHGGLVLLSPDDPLAKSALLEEARQSRRKQIERDAERQAAREANTEARRKSDSPDTAA